MAQPAATGGAASLRERLRDDLKDAMRARDVVRRDTIRLVQAAIKNVEIERRGAELSDADVVVIMQRQVKQRHESITQYEQVNRSDLADVERAELAVIEAYLPQQMSREEIVVTARAMIEQLGARGPSDRGKVMGGLMGQLRGKADGATVNAVVSELLAEIVSIRP